MNEADARDVLLLRAYETAPTAREPAEWSDDDARGVTRTARELDGGSANVEALIARRGRLGAARIRERSAAADRAMRLVCWPRWLVPALVALSLAAGIASDALGAGRRVDLLAPPLLALLAWNLAVYLLIALRAATRRFAGSPPAPGPIERLIARAAQGIGSAGRAAARSAPLQAFGRAWAQAAAPLTAARVAFALHASAAAFAVGALLAMYLRGLVLEYRAGWESTFLDAGAVHTIVSTVLGPASRIGGIALPGVDAIAALRSPAPGENAARWIHLYAITIAIAVLVPRIALACWQAIVQAALAARLPLRLDDAYFRALARTLAGGEAAVQVYPYAMQAGEHAIERLRTLVSAAIGPHARTTVAPPAEYGSEDAPAPAAAPQAPALVLALFTLSATPERETHGAFVASLARHFGARSPLAALVDESALRSRFSGTGASGETRIAERRAAWERMLADIGVPPVFADLEAGDPAAAHPALRAVLERSQGAAAAS